MANLIKICEYVDDFLSLVELQEPLHFEKIIDEIKMVHEYGMCFALKKGLVKRIRGHREPIYEFRVSTYSLEYRFLGTIHDADLYIVHGFVKKEQKTRKKDIDLAKKRLKKVNMI